MNSDQTPPRYCATCGHVVPGDSAFCPSCGTKTELNASSPASEVHAVTGIPEAGPPTTVVAGDPVGSPEGSKSITPIVVSAAVFAMVLIGVLVFFAVSRSATDPTSAASPPVPVAAPAGWSPDPTMANGQAPAILPKQCYNGATPPSVQLTNGKGKIPGTKYGKYALVGTPLRGRFSEGAPENTVYAFTCIGDGTYEFVEVIVINASGQRISTVPASVADAIAPVAEKFAPGSSTTASGPYTFGLVGATPTLAGSWFARPVAAFKATVELIQQVPTASITLKATGLTKPKPAPGVPQGTTYYSPAEENTGEGTMILRRDGNDVRFQQGYSGGINCFVGRITNDAFIGTLKGYGETAKPMSVTKGDIPLSLDGSELTFSGQTYSSGGNQESFDSRCS